MTNTTPETLLKIAQGLGKKDCHIRGQNVWCDNWGYVFDPLNNAEQLKEIVKHWKANVIECVDGDWIAWIKPTPAGSESKNEFYERAILGAVAKAVEDE